MSDPAAHPTQYSFQAVATRRILFQEVEVPPGGLAVLTEGEKINTNMEMELSVSPIEEGKRAHVQLSLKVDPDPKYQPYHIEVSIAGVFATQVPIGEAEFLRFCQVNAPVILWPYARELVNRVTADAIRGPVRLDPVNLAAAFAQQSGVVAASPEVQPAPTS